MKTATEAPTAKRVKRRADISHSLQKNQNTSSRWGDLPTDHGFYPETRLFSSIISNPLRKSSFCHCYPGLEGAAPQIVALQNFSCQPTYFHVSMGTEECNEDQMTSLWIAPMECTNRFAKSGKGGGVSRLVQYAKKS